MRASRSVKRNQLAIVEACADEVRVAVAALLAVGDDVYAGAQLRIDAHAHGVVGDPVEVGIASRPSSRSCSARFIHSGRGQLPMPMTESGSMRGAGAGEGRFAGCSAATGVSVAITTA